LARTSGTPVADVVVDYGDVGTIAPNRGTFADAVPQRASELAPSEWDATVARMWADLRRE